MTYTGIMLFICPHGKVAYWNNWHLFGLSKDQYGQLHTTSMIVMLLFGILHIFYNWKSIVNYMKDKNKKISYTQKEFLIALTINLLFIIGTIFLIQPFKSFLDFEENLKDSWTKTLSEPPYGHAELTKLRIFCKKVGVNYNTAIINLKSKNIIFKTNEKIINIAKENNLTSAKLYNIIKPKNISKKNSIPSKLGKKTLQELNNMGNIKLNKAIHILQQKGIKNISKKSKIKDIADKLNITPREVYKLIGEKYYVKN